MVPSVPIFRTFCPQEILVAMEDKIWTEITIAKVLGKQEDIQDNYKDNADVQMTEEKEHFENNQTKLGITAVT